MTNQQTAAPTGKLVSQVAEDQIRKDTIRKVTRNQIWVWPRRWNWLIDENRKMHEAMAGKRPLSPYDWTRSRAPAKAERPKPAGKKTDGKGKKKKLDVMLPPVPAIPAKPSIPVTTSGWYGFLPKVNGQSIVSDRQRWCKVTVGQHNLTRLFGWPDIFD